MRVFFAIFRLLPLLAVLLATACTSPQDAASTRLPTETVGLEGWVALEAARLGAREFAVTRLETEGDLDGDGRPDQAWVYRLDLSGALETFQQFLAVQISSDSRRIRSLLVGKSGGRSVSEVRVAEGNVELNTQEYLPTDLACCPTGHAALKIGLRSGRLQVLGP